MLRVTKSVSASIAVLLLSNTLALSCVYSPHWATSPLNSADAVFVGELTNADIEFGQEKFSILGKMNITENVARLPGTAKLEFNVIDTIKGQLPKQISVVLLEGVRMYDFYQIPRQNYLVSIKRLDASETLYLEKFPNYAKSEKEIFKLIYNCLGSAIIEYTEESMLRNGKKLSNWNADVYSLLAQVERVPPATHSEGKFPGFGRAGCCGQF